MTAGIIIAAMVAALLLLWWLADHERGMQWTKSAVRRSFPEVPPISADELRKWLDDPGRPQPLLLDVRGGDEFAVSHLHGARLVRPEAQAKDVLGDADANQPVVVYCAGGYRAAKMARRLIEAGRRDVLNLDGGIFAWVNEGHPVERDGREVAQVHPMSRLFSRLLRKSAR
jgi:rhodanese-related sulfurtransferase